MAIIWDDEAQGQSAPAQRPRIVWDDEPGALLHQQVRQIEQQHGDEWLRRANNEIRWREQGIVLRKADNGDGTFSYAQERTAPQKLSSSEKQAVYDAYRQAYGYERRPEWGQGTAEDLARVNYQAIQSQSALQNFGSAAAGTLSNIGLGLVGAVAPETANRLASNTNTAYQYDPDSKAAFAGELTGNLLPLIPALFASPAVAAIYGNATAGGLGSSQFGNVRMQVDELRKQGQQISTGEELAAAALSAAAEFVFERWGLGSMRGIDKSALVGPVKNSILQYSKTAGINASEEFLTQVAQNAIDIAILNQNKPLTEGAIKAMLMGGIIGVAGRGIAGAAQRLQGPPAKAVPAGPTPYDFSQPYDQLEEVPYPGDIPVEPHGSMNVLPLAEPRQGADANPIPLVPGPPAPRPEPIPEGPILGEALPPLLREKTFRFRINEGSESRGVALEFESNIDKALFALAQPRKGKVQAEAQQYLQSVGLTPERIAKEIPAIQAAVQATAVASKGETVRVAPTFQDFRGETQRPQAPGVYVPPPSQGEQLYDYAQPREVTNPPALPVERQPAQPYRMNEGMTPMHELPDRKGQEQGQLPEPYEFATEQQRVTQAERTAKPTPAAAPAVTQAETPAKPSPAAPAAPVNSTDILPRGRQKDVAGQGALFLPSPQEVTEALGHAAQVVKGFRYQSPKNRQHVQAREAFRKHGVELVFYSGEGRGVRLSRNPRMLFINSNNVDANLQEAVAHEFMHELKSSRPELFYEFMSAMPDSVKLEARQWYEQQFGKMRPGEQIDPGLLDEEAVATTFGRIAQHNRVWKAALNERPGLLEKITDFFREFAAKFSSKAKLVQQAIQTFEATLNVSDHGKADAVGTLRFLPSEDVKNPRFRDWFAESKVVDEKGMPAVVYHGTQAATDFSVFNPLSHFGTRKAAEQRIDAKADQSMQSQQWEHARVYPAYVRIRKPISIPDFGANHDVAEYIEAIEVVNSLPAEPYLTNSEIRDILRRKTEQARQRVLIEKLEAKGYDGFRYNNRVEDNKSVSWVPFRPEQVKSAIGNVGTFSPTNPDVRFLPGQSLLKRGGDLPETIARLNEERVGEVASEHRQAEFRLAQLNRAIKAEYGVPARKLPPADIQKINDALKGQSVKLPAKVLDAVEAMRDHVDELSLQIMGSGLVDPDLAAILGKNLGTYLNRSYRIFDDPQWEKKIPPAVRAAAEALIAGQLAAQGKPASLAKVYVDELIQDWKQGGVESLFARGRLGAKNLSILKERQDIAPEIRALMGEYNNPFTNYAKSISKMAALLANHHFLESVKADGMGAYLFADDTAREGFTTRIAAPGSSAMAPLNGLRTSPEIAKAFEDFNKSQELPGWLRLWTVANFLAKSSKTVFSFMTQMRNLIGQPMFNLLSGHYRIGNYGKAAKTIVADLRNKGTAGTEQYIQKLTKLGVLGQSVYANEIMADLKDMGLTDSDVYTESGWLPAIKRGVKKALLLPQTAYHVSDALGKIVGFENELARAKEAYPTLPLEQQEKIAADRVLDTYPTYSRVPPVIQKLRRQPFIGPFVAFWYESFRTVGNSIVYAAQDLASGNKARVRHGAERLAGMSALAAGTIAIQAMTKALLGIDDEEEADFRKFQPEWSRGDIYAFIGRDGQGNLRYIDVSTLNPYSPLVDSAYAIASGEGSVVQRLSAAAAEFLNSLTSEQIFTKAALDVARNRTENGGRIYNPEDTVANQWKDALGHLFNAVEPGTLDRLRHRILPGLRGEETAFGDKIQPGDEITAELTGVKMRSFSFESGLAFQARKFQQHQGDIGGLFLRELSRPGKLNATRVTEAYSRMEKVRYEQWLDLHDKAQAALRSGVPLENVYTAMVRGGVSPQAAKYILAGKYVPYNLKGESIKAAVKQHGDAVPLEALVGIYSEYAGKDLGR